MKSYTLKSLLSRCFAASYYSTNNITEALRRILAHSRLASELSLQLPRSVVVLGRCRVYGTGNVRIGADALLYPDLHIETRGTASISLGDAVVISKGVHLVAMAGIEIGSGTMIGEYTSIRDANHTRCDGQPIRASGHTASPIRIGNEVWIGRGVAVLAGVTIGDGATVGANAVVTRDVPAHSVVGGIPARDLPRSSRR